jgi:replicative DNA helicase
MKDIANDLGVCVLLLLQPTKVSGTPRDPLDSYAKIRGSGNISAACSVIISIWREGFSPRTADQDKFITFGVLKNRMGNLAQLDFGFDGLTGQIYELDETEKQELDELRALNRQERGNSGGFA